VLVGLPVVLTVALFATGNFLFLVADIVYFGALRRLRRTEAATAQSPDARRRST